MTFANFSFVPEELGLFVFFATVTAIVQGGRSMFTSLINLAILHSTKNAESFKGLG